MEKVFIYIDESYVEPIIAVGCTVIQGNTNKNIVTKSLDTIDLDPNVKINNKHGNLHYQESSIGGRQAILRRLRSLPVSNYISYTTDTSIINKVHKDKKAYNNLLPEILELLLKKYTRLDHENEIFLNFENISDKYSQDKRFFEESVSKVGDFNINIVTKKGERQDKISCLPDYFLGTTISLLSKKNSVTWPQSHFELVIDKISLIIEIANQKKYYSRGDQMKKFLEKYSN